MPVTAETGCTRFWPGSHLGILKEDDPAIGPGVDFLTDLGSCYLFDYRVLHCGVANRSDGPRPLLYNIYTKPWFRDTKNYSNQAPLIITEAQIAALPERYQTMLWWSVTDRVTEPRKALCFCGSGVLHERCHGRKADGS